MNMPIETHCIWMVASLNELMRNDSTLIHIAQIGKRHHFCLDSQFVVYYSCIQELHPGRLSQIWLYRYFNIGSWVYKLNDFSSI